ncbi:MAG: PAS domain S-box-containing protein [Paraglaciecola sp.]|jgi:PAS domain S-box-containing protein
MRKYYYIFIGIAGCFISLLGWQSYYVIEKQIQFALSETLNTTLRITQQGIESWVSENKHTINTLVSSDHVISLTEQLLAIDRTPKSLSNSPFQKEIRVFIQPTLIWHKLSGFFLISVDNINLASARDENIGAVNLLTQQPGIMQKLMSGETVVTLPQPSDVPLKNEEGRLTPLYPTMLMGAPIKDKSNKIIAFLTLRIDPSIDFIKVFHRGQLGKTGETYAFNRQGVLISNSRFDDQLRTLGIIDKNQASILNVTLRAISPEISSVDPQGEQRNFTHMAQSALKGHSSSTLLPYPDYRGKDVVGAWAWNEMLGLGIATEQDADEALRPLNTARQMFILFFSIILGGFLCGAILSELSRRKLLAEIDARKSAEKESHKLSMAIEQSPSSVMMTDLKGVIEYVNPKFSEVTGYSRSEVIGENIRMLQAEEGSSTTHSDVWNQLTSGNSWVGELINQRKDGQEYIELIKIAPLFGEDGLTTNYISVTEDITERKKSEQETEYSKLMLECVLDTVGEAIITINKDSVIIMANQATAEMWKYNVNDLIGMDLCELMPEKYREAHKKGIQRCLSSGEAKVLNQRKDLEGLRATGEVFPMEILISETRFDEQWIFTAALRDITEREAAERVMRRIQKMDAIGELSGGLAHDFNNLLGIIIGNLDLISRKVEAGSKLLERIEIARNAALRGAELTRRLLNFARQAPLSTSLVNVNAVLGNIQKMIGQSLAAKITIETILSDDLWMVELDPGDLEDALVNLSMNARDAMPNGGKLIFETRNTILDNTLSLQKITVPPEEYVEVVISDTGEGMTKEVSERIFDPFFSTKEKNKGTGLGLAMVYGFVQRTKGQIYVYSEVGIGTTFKIYFPRSVSKGAAKLLPREDIGVTPKGTETILIVDDEKALVAVAQETLRELGYKTIFAYNAEQALEILEENRTIDLVFSDVVMPGSMGGFELAEVVLSRYPNIKVLLTSGFTGNMEISKISQQWENELLSKPYRRQQLAKQIRKVLEGSN